MKKALAYEELEISRRGVVFLYLALASWYLGWRLTTFNPEAPVFSTVLYGAELFGFLTTLLHLFMTWRLTKRTAPPAPAGKTVDVFITTINEPISVVRRTALTAMALDYPHETWILDDGNRTEMRKMAERIGCRYLARTSNEHAKAGNLNHALAHSKGEFVAIFDADHAPKKDFLTHTLGYFNDTKVSFVQTPQDFYNLDSFQHRRRTNKNKIWTEQSLFFRVIQRGKDFWNAAFFCGSCAIIRRSSLDRIGGFATGTVTEDIHTSIRLHKAGFKSVYHAESLAFGIAPTQIGPFLRQRVRWGQGAMQVWRMEGVLFARGLTIPQRLNYLASMITYFDGWQKLIFYTAPVIVLLTGVAPLKSLNTEFFLHFLPYFLVTFWLFEEIGRGYGDTVRIEQYNMARFGAFLWATFGLFKKNLKFRVTSKTFAGQKSNMFFLMPHYAILLFNMVAIPVGGLLHAVTWNNLSTLSFAANVLWAVVNLVLAASILRFTLGRKGFKRNDYRFTLPLMARLHNHASHDTFVVVQDISSTGIRLLANSPVALEKGHELKGEIYLPDGPLNFVASVKMVRSVKRKSKVVEIGCEFSWVDAHAGDRLELFLYGSDLEWQLHQLQERSLTPLERLLGPMGDDMEHLPAARRWSPVLFHDVNSPTMPVRSGLILHGQDKVNRSLILFNPMHVGSEVKASMYTPQGWQTIDGQIVQQKTVEKPGANVYMYQLATPA